jgi:hypothetical protein
MAPHVFSSPPSPPTLSLHSLESPGGVQLCEHQSSRELVMTGRQYPGSAGGDIEYHSACRLFFSFWLGTYPAGTHIALTTKNMTLETSCLSWLSPVGLPLWFDKNPTRLTLQHTGPQYEGLGSLSVFYTGSRLLVLPKKYSSYRDKHISPSIKSTPSTVGCRPQRAGHLPQALIWR